jgi:anti-anti-sigma regulatory factor
MVIIDVAALDVVDSFAAHILASCATMARLRGARLAVVGIQPDVALTMVERAHTALDLRVTRVSAERSASGDGG